MNNVPAEFLRDSIKGLAEIIEELQPDPRPSQKLLRTLHTIKGSAQTFGLQNEANLAHAIETCAAKVLPSETNELAVALALLKENLTLIRDSQTTLPVAQMILSLSGSSGEARENASRELPSNFPAEVFAKLGAAEQGLLLMAWQAGEEVLILQFRFSAAGLGERFKIVRSALDGNGRVIAVLPGKKKTGEDGAAFDFLLATTGTMTLEQSLKYLQGRVLYQNSKREPYSTALSGNLFETAIAHGKAAANALGKEIRFSIAGDDSGISPSLNQALSAALLHIVRNAADHGIEFPLERNMAGKPRQGRVEIAVNRNESGIRIEISDDGRGMPDSENIFDAGYSTAAFVTGLSGRGIGLDAVMDAIKSVNGTIEVESRSGEGCKFTIKLPTDREK
jgi:chemotaxis protein histidine kinase CheA